MAHLLGQRGHALDELADDEREDPADHREAGEQHQRHRDAARRTAAVEEVHGGQQQGGHHRRQGHRHEDQFEALDHPEHRDDGGEDHQ